MVVKEFISKCLDLDLIRKDIECGELHGVHYHDKGHMDEDYGVLELIFCRSQGNVYAIKLYLDENTIVKIHRVKFETMCGGWRSNDTLLKRFPVGMNSNELNVSEIMKSYIINTKP